MENLSGQNLKGYELHERIGAGGFGAVYRAYQATVNREVAIKIILPGVAHQPDFVRRFEMEAQLVARLEHMNIVPLYDYWRDQSGAYLVLRWLRGGSLRDRLEKGACSLEETAHILSQLTSALATAHRHNVIHRDLKPANILLDEDGNAYLTDFGIAKDNNSADGSITEADVIVGTLDYISPEQARSEQVTPRTDIYSLGVVLYEMLMGEHPFRDAKSTVERLYKHLSEPLPDVTSLPANISDRVNVVIQKATAKDPAQRYADTLEFGNAFIEAARLQVHQLGESVVELITPREQEVLQLMMNNLSNKEIAERLFVSVNTVKYFQKQIYSKLRVRNRVQAITRARELELVFGNQDNGTRVMSSSSIIAQLPEPQNPYKGLQAFQAADSQDFYGREHLIEKIIKRMGEKSDWSRFLAVVGPSGSGKSSVVKAGVIPALWRGELKGSDRWFVAEMIPGTHPLEELEIALAQISTSATTDIMQQLERDERGLLRAVRMILPDDGSELVLVIDQFEEVFTLVEDEQRRAHFLQLLFNAVSDPRSRVRIVITLRADFYDRPLHYADFGDMLRARMETILPLSAAELEQAIVTPAKRQGVQFEEGLVAAIISSVNYQPGALPLLQYALTELFERKEKRLLTHAAYKAIGGTVGALAKRADELYLELDETGRDLVRQVFLRLVTLGEHNEDTRRRTPRSELLSLSTPPLYSSVRNEPALMESDVRHFAPSRQGSGGEVDLLEEIIDTYAAYRLLSLDNDPNTRIPTVEVAHEAILSEWKRLKQWINESREDIEMQQQITHMAAEWHEAKRDTSYLVSGLRLEQMEAWAETANVALTPIEQAFLQTSIAERNARKAAEQARKEYEAGLEQKSVRRLRLLVATFAIASVLALLLSAVALVQRNAAIEQGQIAEQRADDLYSLSLVSAAQDAMSAGDTGLALSLAMESITNDTPSADTERVMNSLAQQPGPIRLLYEGDFTAWTLSPDYQSVAVGTQDGTVTLVNMASGAVIRQFTGHHAAIKDMRFNFDGTRLIAWTESQRYHMWDVATAESIAITPRLHFAFTDADGKFAFTPDNQNLLILNRYGSVARLLNIETGEELRVYRADNPQLQIPFNRVAISPDGQFAIGGGFIRGSVKGSIVVWDMATGAVVQRMDDTGTAQILNVGFIPNSNLVWASTASNTYIIDMSRSYILREYPGAIPQQSLIPVGRTTEGFYQGEIGTGSSRRIMTNYQGATLWSRESGQEVVNLPLAEDFYLLENGNLAVIATGQRLELWDFNIKGSPNISLQANRNWVFAVAYSPDGHTVLTGGGQGCDEGEGDNRLILSDTTTGMIIHEMVGHQTMITDVAFSPDGHYALSSSRDGVAILWDLATGTEVRRFTNSTTAFSVAFSPDGQEVIVGYTSACDFSSGDREIVVWDIETGSIIRRIAGPTEGGWAEIGSNGRYAYFVGDNSISIIDVNSGLETTSINNTSQIMLMYFRADEQTIFSVDASGQVTERNIATGAIMRTIDASVDIATVAEAYVSPNGQYMITGHLDPSQTYCQPDNDNIELDLWDLTTGEVMRRWNAEGCRNRIAFSPDSKTVMVGGYGITRFYTVETQSPLEWLHTHRYIREFTCEERQQYRIEPLCEE